MKLCEGRLLNLVCFCDPRWLYLIPVVGMGTGCFGKQLSCGFLEMAFACPCPRVGSLCPCPCWTSNCLWVVRVLALMLFVLWNFVRIGSVMKYCGRCHAEISRACLYGYWLNCCSVFVAFDGDLRLGFDRWS